MSQTFEDSEHQVSPSTGQYNWLGVLKFLQDQYKEENFKDTESILERQQQQEKIAQLEGELKGQEAINKDLMKRIKMLEFALRQERLRYTKLLQGSNVSEDIIKSVLSEENSISAQSNAANLPLLPERKPKTHRPLLLKMLEDLGLENIFDSENEANKANQQISMQNQEFQHRDSSEILKGDANNKDIKKQ